MSTNERSDPQLSDRLVVWVFFGVAALATWTTIAVAHGLSNREDLSVGVMVVIIVALLLVGIQTTRHFTRPHLSLLGMPLVAVAWGFIIGPGGEKIPIIGIAWISVFIYAIAGTIAFVILQVHPRMLVNVWLGLGLLIVSVLGAVLLAYTFAPAFGVDLNLPEYRTGAFWALYLEALFLLAVRAALVAQDRCLEKVFDLAGKLVFDQATLALRKLNFKYAGENQSPPVLKVGKAERSFTVRLKLGGWVFTNQLSVHKAHDGRDL